MVSLKSVEKQLKNIRFNSKAWGKGEISELPNILMDNEKIFECVNGTYEGGFALLCATNIRLLLIDKKPMKFLTVEDLRFDMINQIDYSHRLMGARINVSTGNKNLKFTSYNQQRLRKLINHIQHRMADIKNELSNSAETQQQHLERINQQLQTYLLAQHQQQEDLRQKLEESQQKGRLTPDAPAPIEPVRPAPELADFLFAQSLMQQYQSAANAMGPAATTGPIFNPISLRPSIVAPIPATDLSAAPVSPSPIVSHLSPTDTSSLVEAGRKEVFGVGAKARAVVKPLQTPFNYLGEINPLRIACAKLPSLLRSRKFSHLTASAATTQKQPTIVPSGTQIAGA